MKHSITKNLGSVVALVVCLLAVLPAHAGQGKSQSLGLFLPQPVTWMFLLAASLFYFGYRWRTR